MDFQFLQDSVNKNWVVLAPRRAKRPQEEGGKEPPCPFCSGGAGDTEEIDRLGSVRVLSNKFPFAPIHEVIIHSPDHQKNFDELPVEHVAEIFKMYQKRYLLHQKKGQVYIFHNRGEAGGESLPHPHSQLVVVPNEVKMQIPILPDTIPSLLDCHPREGGDPETRFRVKHGMTVEKVQDDKLSTEHFSLFCPQISQWPDEVWIAPKAKGKTFGEITDEEISDLANIMHRLIQIMDVRHNNDFPFNFYIAPGNDWYLRIIPRLKTLGGFELGTNIYVNTQDPKETMAFIREHFDLPADELDIEKIKREHKAAYERRV